MSIASFTNWDGVILDATSLSFTVAVFLLCVERELSPVSYLLHIMHFIKYSNYATHEEIIDSKCSFAKKQFGSDYAISVRAKNSR